MLRNIPATISFIKLFKWNSQSWSNKLLFSPYCTQTPNCSKLTGDWTNEATQLLHLIVAEYSVKKNKTFVLPWADQEAIKSTIYPFERLLFQGVASQFLLDICLGRESLFRKMTKEGNQTYQILLVFVENFAMTFEDATRLFGRWSDEMTGETAESIQKRMSVFLGRGISSGPQLGKIVKKCPALLFSGDAQKMDSCLERIMNYFHAGQLKKLMQQSPHICLLNEDELEEKYEYIYYHMGIECTELVDSIQWMDLKLEQIISRHQFLCKVGKYFFPDPKKPQLKKDNPTARQIFDTDEQKFAEEIGEITNEEWLIFQELWERERRMAELDKPYERIKPSQRKAFERKFKNARTAEEGEISDGVLSHQ